MHGLSESQRNEIQNQQNERAQNRRLMEQVAAEKSKSARTAFVRGFMKGVSVGLSVWGSVYATQNKQKEGAKETTYRSYTDRDGSKVYVDAEGNRVNNADKTYAGIGQQKKDNEFSM